MDGAGATEDGTWDGAGATEDAVSMPTMAECMACTACAPCDVCLTDPAACAPGTDLYQTCAVDCAPAGQAGALADLCATDLCAGCQACLPCADDETKCAPGGAAGF